MSFFAIKGGIRRIPTSLLAQGQCYSTALHCILHHNQEMLQDSIVSRQLVNDYFPNSSGVAHGELATPTGSMIAQWGRFEHQPGMMITARVFAAINDNIYTDSTYLRLICTPKLLNPNARLGSMVSSLKNSLYHAVETVNSATYSYYAFTVLPQALKGKTYYLSLWKQSADPGETDNSEIYLRLFSAYEEPEV